MEYVRSNEGYPLWEEWWRLGRPGRMSPPEFLLRMQQWAADRSHSGPEPSDALVEFTRLNAQRMKRLVRTTQVPEALLDQSRPLAGVQHWVLITESWCGDAAQIAPLLIVLAQQCGVQLDIILRDDEHGVIADFLTNGGRAIPIWVVASEKGEVLRFWGPRPQHVQQMVQRFRDAPEPKESYLAFSKGVQQWYNADGGRAFFGEAGRLLNGVQEKSEG